MVGEREKINEVELFDMVKKCEYYKNSSDWGRYLTIYCKPPTGRKGGHTLSRCVSCEYLSREADLEKND